MGARAIAVGLAVVGLLAACGDEPVAPLFPESYASTYVEVRDCRRSADHDLGQIRVLADPAAAGPYVARDVAFPVGATVLKVEYDFGDLDCAGPIRNWTVMQRVAEGGDPLHLGWAWQRVEPDRTVTSEHDSRCLGCHARCGVAPDGYLGTCAVP